MTEVNIFIAFTAGIFSFLSPCVLPLIPSYLSFVSGVSLEEMRAPQVESRVRWRVALNSLAFIFGFSLVFVSLGVSASFLGSLFLGYRSFIRILGGLFIVLVGIYLMGFFKIAALERYLQFHLRDKPSGYLGSFLVGVTFAVALNSCFQFFAAFRRHVHLVHRVAGILLVIVGILLITDYVTLLNIYAIRFTPEWLIKRL